MAESAVRTQIYLEPIQHRALKDFAKARATSMAQVVREAIASYLARTPTKTLSDEAYLADPIWSLPEVGAALDGSGPSDLAERHDTYLYGPDQS